MNIVPAPLSPKYEVLKFCGCNRPEILKRISRLRLSVWQNEGVKMVGDFTSGHWTDDEEGKSVHWAVLCDGELVGASRMTLYHSLTELPDYQFYTTLPKINSPISYLTRDVVTKPHQGRGIGRYLNYVRMLESENVGAKTILVSVPDYRITSFEKLGFKLIRPPKFGYVFPETKWAVMLLDL